jgi:hypothetical protein
MLNREITATKTEVIKCALFLKIVEIKREKAISSEEINVRKAAIFQSGKYAEKSNNW